MEPVISILISTFNHKKYIQTCIESVLNQTYKNIDETPGIIKSYQDEGIKYIRHKTRKTLTHALNTGFAMTTGEYLAWTSDDNCYAEEDIESMDVLLQQNKKIDFVYPNYCVINRTMQFC